jgi:hypothetical protein
MSGKKVPGVECEESPSGTHCTSGDWFTQEGLMSAGGEAQVVEHLSSKNETLCSNSSATKKKKEKELLTDFLGQGLSIMAPFPLG